MKKIVLATVLAAIGSASALAADLPAVNAAYNWSGFYAGMNAGGFFGKSDPRFAVNDNPLSGFLLGTPLTLRVLSPPGNRSD